MMEIMMEISHETADAILRDNLREHITMLQEWNDVKQKDIDDGFELHPVHKENFIENQIAIRHMTWVLEYFGGSL